MTSTCLQVRDECRKISEKSDFCIRPLRKDREFLPERLPLVLPDNAGYAGLYYIVDRWDTETEVSTCDPLPLNQRRLPGSGELYPYLSIGDFLEDTIVTLYNEIREDCFYPGERTLSLKNAKLGCMLPPKAFASLTISAPMTWSTIRCSKWILRERISS